MCEATGATCRAPHHTQEVQAPPTPASQTSLSQTPPPTPNPAPRFHDILDVCDFDQFNDREGLEKHHLTYIRNLSANCTRAMAADFSEGRLETSVGSPLKELSGTQNQYVSYQVTTKVGAAACSSTAPL